MAVTSRVWWIGNRESTRPSWCYMAHLIVENGVTAGDRHLGKDMEDPWEIYGWLNRWEIELSWENLGIRGDHGRICCKTCLKFENGEPLGTTDWVSKAMGHLRFLSMVKFKVYAAFGKSWVSRWLVSVQRLTLPKWQIGRLSCDGRFSVGW